MSDFIDVLAIARSYGVDGNSSTWRVSLRLSAISEVSDAFDSGTGEVRPFVCMIGGSGGSGFYFVSPEDIPRIRVALGIEKQE